MVCFQSTLRVGLSWFVVAAFGTAPCRRATVRFGIDTLIANILMIYTLLCLPYGIGQAIIFLPCGFSSIYVSSFFFPRLIPAVAGWMSAILAHMVWPYCEFRMQVWNVLHAARWKYRTQKIAQNSLSRHHHTNLSGYIFATKARIDNRKNVLNSITSPTRLYNMVTSAH